MPLQSRHPLRLAMNPTLQPCEHEPIVIETGLGKFTLQVFPGLPDNVIGLQGKEGTQWFAITNKEAIPLPL
jgi:hypothetical protein